MRGERRHHKTLRKCCEFRRWKQQEQTLHALNGLQELCATSQLQNDGLCHSCDPPLLAGDGRWRYCSGARQSRKQREPSRPQGWSLDWDHMGPSFPDEAGNCPETLGICEHLIGVQKGLRSQQSMRLGNETLRRGWLREICMREMIQRGVVATDEKRLVTAPPPADQSAKQAMGPHGARRRSPSSLQFLEAQG
jgi:hypothetical protein